MTDHLTRPVGRPEPREASPVWPVNQLDDPAPDPVAQAPGRDSDRPERQLATSDAMQELEAAVHALPARQQQAFMLRALEGLNVADTAQAMGCSEGSVKTHYSRAVHSLRATLGDHWE